VATALLVAGLETPFASTSSYTSIVQSGRLLLQAANLRLIPINTRHMMTTLFNWSSSSEPWWPKRRQSMITALTTLPQGWVSARKHQCTTVITRMWTESSWVFPAQVN